MPRALIPPKGKLIPFFKIHFSNNKKGGQKGRWQGMGLGRGALPCRGGSIAGKKADRPWMPFPGEQSLSPLAGAGCAGAGSLPASGGEWAPRAQGQAARAGGAFGPLHRAASSPSRVSPSAPRTSSSHDMGTMPPRGCYPSSVLANHVSVLGV